jgi:hypothetical protein
MVWGKKIEYEKKTKAKKVFKAVQRGKWYEGKSRGVCGAKNAGRLRVDGFGKWAVDGASEGSRSSNFAIYQKS